MRINNNLMAMNTHRQLGIANNSSSKSMEKLSSGYRINRAGDDAAGLSISEKMRGQIRGLTQASRNAQDGISLIQTAEGALNETHSILQRMRELTVQAGNGTNQSEDLSAIKDEMDALIKEIDGIANRTQFNGKTLLNGDYDTAGNGITFQIGANGGQQVELTILGMASKDLAAKFNYTDADGNEQTEESFTLDKLNVTDFASHKFEKQLGAIDSAIKEVSSQRSSLGALQNRLEHTIKNLDNGAENLQAAESRIRDVDMAQEMMELTKQNILQQASQAMLAQANQAPQGVLQLLR